MCLCLCVCLYDSSPTGIITLLHFSTLSVWSKISLYTSADTGPRTVFTFHYSALIMVPNVKYKFNTKEGGPGVNFKGHPILTMQCRIWLHFLCGVIDLIGSLGTNEPNTFWWHHSFYARCFLFPVLRRLWLGVEGMDSHANVLCFMPKTH